MIYVIPVACDRLESVHFATLSLHEAVLDEFHEYVSLSQIVQ